MARRTFCVALPAAAALTPTLCRAGSPPTMPIRPINPTDSAYALACEVANPSRWLFVSGQTPEDADGKVPATFREQARLAWRNVEAQLTAGGMTLDNLAKVTIFLSDRRYRRESYEVRAEVLGKRAPALTIIITGIYDEAWLLEIEAVAAA